MRAELGPIPGDEAMSARSAKEDTTRHIPLAFGRVLDCLML